MSDAPEPYPVEPEPPAEGGAARPAGPPTPAPGAPKPKISAPKLLDDFEEDADFTEDPEVDLAVGRVPKRAVAAAAPEEPLAPEFVKPGPLGAKHWAIAGTVLLVAAMIAAGVNAPYGVGAGQIALRVLLTLYDTLLSTGTGVVAIFIAARLLEERFGNVELAAGRMYTAVAAYMLIYNLQVRLFGANWLDSSLVLLLAAAAYLLIVAWSFRLWTMIPLAYVAGSHLLLWLVMLVGMALSAMIRPGQPRPEGNATPVRIHTPAAPPASPAPAPTGR
jgi:hypothetical protein